MKPKLSPWLMIKAPGAPTERHPFGNEMPHMARLPQGGGVEAGGHLHGAPQAGGPIKLEKMQALLKGKFHG